MKKCVIASDSFKGTLSSKEIADIFETEFNRYFPDTTLEKVVLGDGGENFHGVYEYLDIYQMQMMSEIIINMMDKIE